MNNNIYGLNNINYMYYNNKPFLPNYNSFKKNISFKKNDSNMCFLNDNIYMNKKGGSKCPIGFTYVDSYKRNGENVEGFCRELPKSKCPPGKIYIEGYTRDDGARVEPHCRKDLGEKGKTPDDEKILPPINPEETYSLSNMGYAANADKSDRRKVLRKAGNKYGYLDVLRHLNLRANYQQWNKPIYENMRSDVDFLGKLYSNKKKGGALKKKYKLVKCK